MAEWLSGPKYPTFPWSTGSHGNRPRWPAVAMGSAVRPKSELWSKWRLAGGIDMDGPLGVEEKKEREGGQRHTHTHTYALLLSLGSGFVHGLCTWLDKSNEGVRLNGCLSCHACGDSSNTTPLESAGVTSRKVDWQKRTGPHAGHG